MSRRTVWFSLSVICLSTILGLGLVLVVQAGALQERSITGTANGLYTIKLPLMVKNYVPPRIIIWHQWDDSYLTEYKAIIQEFNLAHPDMTIGIIKVDGLASALSIAIPAGVGPDIVAYANDPIEEWASLGYIAPLDPYLDPGYMDSNFEPVAIKAVTWDDQIWGIPEFQEGIALVYNRDLITDTEVPEANDFADLLTKAADFQLENPDKYYLCNQGLGGYNSYHAAPIYFGYGLSEYGGYIDENGTVYMTTTEAISGAQWIADFSLIGPPVTDHVICRDMMVNEVAAMWWTGPWAISDLKSNGVKLWHRPDGKPICGCQELYADHECSGAG